MRLLHKQPTGVKLGKTDETLKITVFLRLRRRPGHDPIPSFSDYLNCPPRRRLGEDEFARRYGASDEDVAAIKDHYEQLGFSTDHHMARRHVHLTGTAQFNQAFNVELQDYEKLHGKDVVQFRSHAAAPEVPDRLADLILGVHDLENEPTILPPPVINPAIHPNILPATLASIYQFPSSYSGSGQIIVIYLPLLSPRSKIIQNSTFFSGAAFFGASIEWFSPFFHHEIFKLRRMLGIKKKFKMKRRYA